MRIVVDKIGNAEPSTLMRALVRLQDAINVVLGKIPFDYGERINLTTTPEVFPRLIAHHMPRPAWGFHLVYLKNLTAETTIPVNGVFVDWIPDSGGVRIRSVSGLTANHLYEMRFIAYG